MFLSKNNQISTWFFIYYNQLFDFHSLEFKIMKLILIKIIG